MYLCMFSWLYMLKTHSCQQFEGNIMYNEYRHPAFLRGLIVSEIPDIIDHAILRTISKYGSLVNNPCTRLEHLMIFSGYMSFALDEVGNILVAAAKEDVQKGLSYDVLQTTINQVYVECHHEFVHEIANFYHNLEI